MNYDTPVLPDYTNIKNVFFNNYWFKRTWKISKNGVSEFSHQAVDIFLSKKLVSNSSLVIQYFTKSK